MELIVAVYDDWGIGRDGTQPIALSADRKFFRETTRGAMVIAGRRTIADFPGQKPLPGRVNIALTRSGAEIPGFTVCASPEEAVELTKAADRAMVIGGGSIYKQMLPYCDTAYITKVHVTPDSDTFFPNLDEMEDWYLAETLQSGEENGIGYEMLVYKRKGNPKDIESNILEYYDRHRKSHYALEKYLLKDGEVHPVAVICPGGGYGMVCGYSEGHPFAKKLNQMGYHAFVVYYRVGEEARYPAPQDDLARAIRTIFDHAEEWKLDMKNYSVWGSSAGGHLVGSFGTEHMGYLHYDLPKPGALVLIYPVVTMGEKTHMGSRENLLGRDAVQTQIDFASLEKQITSAYPPTFVWWGDADTCVPPDNGRMLIKALEEKNIPCRGIEYPNVGHGTGVGIGLPCEGWFEKAVEFWEAHR